MKHTYDPKDTEDRIAMDDLGAHWNWLDWLGWYLVMASIIICITPCNWAARIKARWQR
jgi:hypothetical protein